MQVIIFKMLGLIDVDPTVHYLLMHPYAGAGCDEYAFASEVGLQGKKGAG